MFTRKHLAGIKLIEEGGQDAEAGRDVAHLKTGQQHTSRASNSSRKVDRMRRRSSGSSSP